MKKCKKCGVSKPPEDYYQQYGYLRPYCKKCWKIINSGKSLKWLHKQKDVYGLSMRAIQMYGLKTALLVYDRAKRKCEQCGSEYDLTTHHKDGNGRNNFNKGLPMNNNPENLIVLCRSCHGRLHAIEQWKNIQRRENENKGIALQKMRKN